jgi:hypothetical protein
MQEGFRIIEDKELDGSSFFSVSGKLGDREYFRMGHFISVDEAKKHIDTLKEPKKKIRRIL